MSFALHELTDGGQPAADVAALLAGFLAGAEHSLEIAIYDLSLPETVEAVLSEALAAAAARGVVTRLVYNVDHWAHRPYPPPPMADPAALARLGVPSRPVSGVPDLMHHKYVVRDAGGAAGAVWTGSTNWTADSWTREENLVLELPSPGLAADYRRNFEELWESGSVQASGHFDPGWSSVDVEGRAVQARPIFSPGRGRAMSHLAADRIGQARRRLRVCSPVLTSGPVLASLAEIPAGLDCRVVYDRTQMAEVLSQWGADPHGAWKAPVFREAMSRLAHASKVTTPYAPGTVHDYMHAKFVVADDVVLAGSYNLSRSGEMNAENVVELRDPAIADRLAAFADRLFDKYRQVGAAG